MDSICVLIWIWGLVAPSGLILIWMALQAKKPEPPSHQHLWDVNGAQPVNVIQERGGTPTEHYTVVLDVCIACGDSRTRELDGHWSVEQLSKGVL